MWDFRIVEKMDEEGRISQGIHEVYYDECGDPQACTVEPVRIDWEKGESTAFIINALQEAFKQPILQYDDFENKEVF